VQLSRHYPCFGCWSTFREGAEHLRGVTAVGFSAYPVIFTALLIAMGLLDEQSEAAEFMTNGLGQTPTQVFILDRFGGLERPSFERLRSCLSCGGTAADISPAVVHHGRREHKLHRMHQRAFATQPDRPVYGQRLSNQVALTSVIRSTHPAAYRGSKADPGELIGSGLCVLLWWFVFTEGFNGFQAWWNPIAWAAVVWWFFYAFSS